MIFFLLLFALVWTFGVWALYRGFLAAPELEDERFAEAKAEIEELERKAAEENGVFERVALPGRVDARWNEPLATFPRS